MSKKVSKKKAEDLRLVTFFYMLLRDALPCGQVIEIVEEARPFHENKPVAFSNAYLELLARDLVKRLTETAGKNNIGEQENEEQKESE